jgi:hypothetical protein
MKYTKKERRKIYLKSSDLILKRGKDCICWAIWIIAGRNCGGIVECITDKVKEDFPEFAMFDPEEGKLYWFGDPYFGTSREQINNRINCLLLCAEMCNDI